MPCMEHVLGLFLMNSAWKIIATGIVECGFKFVCALITIIETGIETAIYCAIKPKSMLMLCLEFCQINSLPSGSHKSGNAQTQCHNQDKTSDEDDNNSSNTYG